MSKDPNEWANLANQPKYKETIARFKNAIPKNQAPLSKLSTYNINNYWRAKVEENN